MARVFISHSSRDNELADRIKTWLSEQGFETPFLDYDKHAGIPPGADWEKTLYREIDRSEAIIIIQTPNWLDSKWCFAEFTQARALGKSIFPIIEAPTGDTLISPDIQALDLRNDREGGLEQLSSQLTQLALDAQGGFGWDASRAPYPGLLAFQEEDAALYFGRDDDIRRLIERLDARRAQGGKKLIALLGASGSGKSSLLRAGIIPRLKRARRNWIVLPTMRPQVSPVDELARCLAVACGEGANWREIRESLNANDLQTTLADIASDLRTKASANEAQILLPIDQGEELFGASNPSQSARFCEILNTALSADLPFIAVVAIRSDYLGLLQSAEHLTTRFEEFSLGPMPLARIPQIIEGPAGVAGLGVDEAFVHQAAQDAQTEDALPLLAFALRELYDRGCDDNYLSLDEYNALGDKEGGLTPLENAVRNAADEVLAEAQPSEEEIIALREAFVPLMVRVNDQGEYVRQPAQWNNLPAKAHSLLERLAKARLLIISQDGDERMIEVAHEAMLRKWPRLRNWLDDAREFLAGKQQLESDLRDWESVAVSDKHKALLTGLKLNRAQGWLIERPHQLTAQERLFVQTSIEFTEAEENKKIRARKNITRVSVFAALILAGVAAFAGIKWQQANEAVIKAKIAVNQAVTAEAEAIKQTLDANKAKKEVVPWIVRASWRSGSEYDQPKNYVTGVRTLIEHADSIINLEKVRFLAPMNIFTSGPHQDKFDWNSNEFGHYNPEFVEWLGESMIPGAEDPLFRKATQAIYDEHLSTLARAYCRSYQALANDPKSVAILKEEYLRFLDDPNQNFSFNGGRFYQFSSAMEYLEPGLFGVYAHVAAGFWLRRDIDGSADAFIAVVRKLLNTYDPEYARQCASFNTPFSDELRNGLLGTWIIREAGRDKDYRTYVNFYDDGRMTIRNFNEVINQRWRMENGLLYINDEVIDLDAYSGSINLNKLANLGEQSISRLHSPQRWAEYDHFGDSVDQFNTTEVRTDIGSFVQIRDGFWRGPDAYGNTIDYIDAGRGLFGVFLYSLDRSIDVQLDSYKNQVVFNYENTPQFIAGGISEFLRNE